LGTGDSIIKAAGTYPCQTTGSGVRTIKEKEKETSRSSFLTLGVGARGGNAKEKEKEKVRPFLNMYRALLTLFEQDAELSIEPIPTIGYHAPNVFSLVERFTFRPYPSEFGLPAPLPIYLLQFSTGRASSCEMLAARTTRGSGICQCANMICGIWERYPREFAKCRRCRKARYCGKECQSKAWSDGHRFWCSVKEAAAPSGSVVEQGSNDDAVSIATARPTITTTTARPTITTARTRLDGATAARIAGLPALPNRHEIRAAEMPGDGPLPPGTVAFATPTTGTHTVIVRMRPDGTILTRHPNENPNSNPQLRLAIPTAATATAPIPIPTDTIVIGTLPNQNTDMSFSPPNIPSNDIFSRDVDPDSFVRPIPRRRPAQVPSASTGRMRHQVQNGRAAHQPMDEDVEMA
jgi:hypothetical protein